MDYVRYVASSAYNYLPTAHSVAGVAGAFLGAAVSSIATSILDPGASVQKCCASVVFGTIVGAELAANSLASRISNVNSSPPIPAAIEEPIPDYGDLVIPRGADRIVIPLDRRHKAELHQCVREIEIATRGIVGLNEGEKIRNFEVCSFKKRTVSFQKETTDPITGASTLGPREEYSLADQEGPAKDSFMKLINFYNKMLETSESNKFGEATERNNPGHRVTVDFKTKTYSELNAQGTLISEGMSLPREYLNRIMENQNTISYLLTPPSKQDSCFVAQMMASPGISHVTNHVSSRIKKEEEDEKKARKTVFTLNRYDSSVWGFAKEGDDPSKKKRATEATDLVKKRVTNAREVLETTARNKDLDQEVKTQIQAEPSLGLEGKEQAEAAALEKQVQEEIKQGKEGFRDQFITLELLTRVPMLSEVVNGYYDAFARATDRAEKAEQCYQEFKGRYLQTRGYELPEDNQMVLDLMGFVFPKSHRGEYETFVAGKQGRINKSIEKEMEAFQTVLNDVLKVNIEPAIPAVEAENPDPAPAW